MMTPPNSTAQAPWLETPSLYSSHLSESLGSGVYLKLENLQPSHSFKYRGIALFIRRKWEELGDGIHFVITSGGNAGLAAACAARQYGLRCTVFIPEGVSASTLELLKREKAEVVVAGNFYAESLKAAAELVEREPKTVMIHAYDDPVLWEGHGSMIKEITTQIPGKPDAIFCSVGGGGLLGGIMEGCKAVGWDDVPLVALETIGSDCFYHSVLLNKGQVNSDDKVTLPVGVDKVYDPVYDVHLAHFKAFSSKAAGSLGASQPAEAVLRTALDWKGGVKSISVPDALTMEALVLVANNQKMLVELSCSTALVPAYNPALFDKLVPPRSDGKERLVVFVVCGGFKISTEDVAEYKKLLDEEPRGPGQTWTVNYDDGRLFTFPRIN